MKNKILFAFVLMFLFSFAFWEDNAFIRPDKLNYVPWEVIVKYKDLNQTKSSRSTFSTKSNSLSMFFDELELDNLELKENLDNLGNMALVEIKDDKSVEETIDLLEQNPNVEYAEPNYIRYFFSYNDSVITNDPRKWNQWSLEYIDRPEAYNLYSWVLEKFSIPVAVIDNWVNYNHPDLSGSMRSPINWKCKMKINNSLEEVDCVHWYDFLHWLTTPLPNLSSHWTHVAWIIAATINNWMWIIWINPYAKIAALKVWNSNILTTAAEIQAIDFAIENNIKIINASYWAYSSWLSEKQALERYKNFWWLFVTAAWNDYQKDIDTNINYTTYPCMYDLDNIICVASVDRYWNLSSFSNYWQKSVDIAAPWSDILSTSIEDSSSWTGIYSNNFNNTSDSSWTNGNYFHRWKWDYAYWFTGNTTSPNINLNWKKDVYLDFFLACASYGTDVKLLYSTWNEFNNEVTITSVYNMWYYYTIPITWNYYTDNFLLKFETDSNTYCIIDDLSIYEDPYYMKDEDRYTSMNWTSMATPHVAWLASLVWAINPELTYTEVKNLIMQNGLDLDSLTWKTVSWKVINVKKTLDVAAERSIPPVTWLQSSWTGNIEWDVLDWVNKYYFEVLSWDIVVKTWFVENDISTWLDLTWNYTWRVQWLDELWNKSDFSTWYICQKPILTENNLIWMFSWYECSTLVWNLNYNDNCSDSYEIVWDDGTWTVTFNWTWNLDKEVFIRNQFWEESNHLNIYYTWFDSLPTINKSSYTHPSSITSTSQQNLGNIISTLWVKDWACGEDSISIVSVSCSEWQWSFSSKNLLITAPSNKQWSANCTITFKDDESNLITWNLNYTFNTIQTQVNNWWLGGWWGWWGSNYSCKKLPSNAVANNNLTPKSNTNYSYSTDTSEVCTFQCKSGYIWNKKDNTCDKLVENKDNTWNIVKLEENEDNIWKSDEEFFEKPKNLELFDNNVTNNSFDFSRFNNQNPTSVLLNWYTVEFNNAYEFARRAWITTTDSIEKANMNWSLTRIAMAKMLSNYAMNILWKVPSNSIVPKFPDVSQKMNDDYWWAVTLAYQLWIMWKWVNKFRPNDVVNRAEFGTALSRMLYWTEDGVWNYYSTHLNKLYKEWVISNTDPDLKELRWYVMIMLMRSAKNWNK